MIIDWDKLLFIRHEHDLTRWKTSVCSAVDGSHASTLCDWAKICRAELFELLYRWQCKLVSAIHGDVGRNDTPVMVIRWSCKGVFRGLFWTDIGYELALMVYYFTEELGAVNWARHVRVTPRMVV